MNIKNKLRILLENEVINNTEIEISNINLNYGIIDDYVAFVPTYNDDRVGSFRAINGGDNILILDKYVLYERYRNKGIAKEVIKTIGKIVCNENMILMFDTNRSQDAWNVINSLEKDNFVFDNGERYQFNCEVISNYEPLINF